MIQTLLCADGARVHPDLRHADPRQVLSGEHSILWLDLERPTAEELHLVAGEFGFHPLAIEDLGKRQRPKIDRYATFHFIVVYDIDYHAADDTIDEHQLNIFLGSNYLVTVHDEPIAEIGEVAERWQRNADQIERGIDVLLYSLLDTIVDHYFPVVDAIGDRIEALENAVFRRATRARLQQVFALKRELLLLRRTITPERDVMALLAKRDLPAGGEAVTVGGEAVAVYFQDIYDHVLRVTEAIDTYRDLLSGVLDSYLSMNANNLNEIMKVLTSYSIILMSVTLIAGIYGMNFDNMPELHTRYGYFAALGAMVFLGLTLAAYFKRKGWL